MPSHLQLPDTQCFPAPQAPPVPHIHTPPVQLFDLVASQAAPEPHIHTPPVQALAKVELQATHALPLIPQVAKAAALQVPVGLVQQPFAHEVASHTQAPSKQRWPTAQAPPAPHLHDVLSQLSEVVGLQAAPVPHLHAPPVQLLAVASLHAIHTLPLAPHESNVGGEVLQLPLVVAVQQPFEQEVLSHTQVPDRQR